MKVTFTGKLNFLTCKRVTVALAIFTTYKSQAVSWAEDSPGLPGHLPTLTPWPMSGPCIHSHKSVAWLPQLCSRSSTSHDPHSCHIRPLLVLSFATFTCQNYPKPRSSSTFAREEVSRAPSTLHSLAEWATQPGTAREAVKSVRMAAARQPCSCTERGHVLLAAQGASSSPRMLGPMQPEDRASVPPGQCSCCVLCHV